MTCYLCGNEAHSFRKGKVRDNPTLSILECTQCGLVSLGSSDHIPDGHYEASGMHGVSPQPIESWLRDTDRDDQRRCDMLAGVIANRRILDFGCGAAGFLEKARPLARSIAGVELERRVRDYWQGRIKLYSSLAEAGDDYDLITAFHVVEHLPDPRAMLQELVTHLAAGGRLVVEVPSADDALLTLYDCDAFQRFTYWSQHLYLFTAATLRQLAIQAGLRVIAIEQFQRYPLSNHLHWLSRHAPGGHVQWSFLDSEALSKAYANVLGSVGKCDTLIAHLEKDDCRP